jgi:protein-L-isoaspartate(D-aspartate) O-methyltransferase
MHGSIMDFETKRKQMVETQLLPRGIDDPLVLKAMRKVPRELFVPKNMRDTAYSDNALPIAHNQTISQPYIVALMTQALELKGGEKVLEIGTGSGYQSAVLAEIAGEVYTVERIAPLTDKAKQILGQLGYTNIRFKVYNGTLGWEDHAPYDAIIVTAGAPHVPDPYVQQLVEAGRLVIPVGDRLSQDLIKITKRNGKPVKQDLGGVRFVSLVGQQGWKE